MTIRTVLKMGDPRLQQKAAAVTEFGSDVLHALIADMFATMHEYGGVGLAATQIGVNQRVIVFGFDENARYPEREPVPTTVLINPVITPLTDKRISGWEGCLSVPGLRGLVPRWQSIHYQGVDANGNTIERDVSDFHAVVVQHEVDHLDGILFPQRIENLKDFGFETEVQSRLDWLVTSD